MGVYDRFFFPLLARMDAERAHERALSALEMAQNNAPGRAVLRGIAGAVPQRPFQLFDLTFPNVLGMAAGFDKDVRVARGLSLLGFGHVEVGTLTPRPQSGNPRPRIFRLREDRAVINRMGFPNGGVETAVPRLQALAQKDRGFVLGVSLGKQKETPLANADRDYVNLMRAVFPFADYLAINISSPNTPGLRELQGGRYLEHLLDTLHTENKELANKHGINKRPLLVKIAPDLTWSELDEILHSIQAAHVDGIIAVNTTLRRDNLTSSLQNEAGGLSGRPLTQRSTEIIHYIARQTRDNLPIIGVGGVASAKDVQAKLNAGAALVQLYTGLVYAGPRIAGRILRKLAYNL